jgi:LacI family transcriptional regulator
MFADAESERKAAGAPCPVVNVSDMSDGLILPRVVPDHREVGAMAAEHLLSKGLRHFSFFGQRNRLWDTRCEGFVSRLAAAHRDCVRMEVSHYAPDVRRALESLPTPVGILAANDHIARRIVEVCDEAGLSVPNDVAVIGVDDDEVLCMVIPPFLSTVDTDGERVGVEAARLIDRILDGQAPPASPILVPPRRIVERASTDMLAVNDEALVRAVRFIREHACDGITAEGVAAALRIPDRSLRDKFRRHLNTTAHSEIRRVQFANVKRMLVESNLTVDEIGRRCGFPHYGRFSAAFRNAFGMPPGAYRRQSSLH